jgi:hypothetical protein
MNRGLVGISNEKIDAIDLTTRNPGPGILSGNSFYGFQAGQNVQPTQITATGIGAAAYNTFIGYQAGGSTTTGDSNVFIGFKAAQAATTLNQCVVIGSLASISSFNLQIVIGANATASNTGAIAIGSSSTSGGQNAIAIGSSAGASASNAVAIGNAAKGAGQLSISIGTSAGANNIATGAVLIGYQAGWSNSAGVNTFVGFQAGYTATTANATTTGTGQTCLGWNTGQNVTSATAPNYITCLGYQAQAGASGAVAIGTDSSGTGASTSISNAIQLGTTNHTVYLAASNTSSGATASTPTFANGTAAQLGQTTKDAMVYLTVGTAGTAMTITIGPTSTPANTVVSSSVATAGELYAIRLPAGWFLKWADTTGTIANQLAVTC